MAKIKRKINGLMWTIKTVTAKAMLEETEDAANLITEATNIAGLCVAAEKTIYIDEDCVTLPVIYHELLHAFISDLYVEGTHDLNMTDFEEMVVCMLVEKSELISRKAKKIHRDMKKLQEEE